MKIIYLGAALMGIAACQPTGPVCGADQLAKFVGQPGLTAFKAVATLPASVTNYAVYAGTNEDLSELPSRSTVIELDIDEVNDQTSLENTVRRVYCLP